MQACHLWTVLLLVAHALSMPTYSTRTTTCNETSISMSPNLTTTLLSATLTINLTSTHTTTVGPSNASVHLTQTPFMSSAVNSSTPATSFPSAGPHRTTITVMPFPNTTWSAGNPWRTSPSTMNATQGVTTISNTTQMASTATVNATQMSTTAVNATQTSSYLSSSTSAETSPESTAPITVPSQPYTIFSVRSASPIHLLPMNAAGLTFWLGGEPATYCPSSVNETHSCPPGNATAFAGCGLDTQVPGGQITYIAPDGSVGFTQAHSSNYPKGAILCPLVYLEPQESDFAYITTSAFGSEGFMACPAHDDRWQVFAAMDNATVPNGNVSSCVGFDAIASDYGQSGTFRVAAWQYI